MPHDGADVMVAPIRPQFARSASFHNIPTLGSPHGLNGSADIKKTLSEVNLTRSGESDVPPDNDGFTTGKDILRRTSRRAKREEPCFTLPTDAPSEPELSCPRPAEPMVHTAPEPPVQSRSMTEAFANFTRKKWRASSNQIDSAKPAKLTRPERYHAREPPREQTTKPADGQQNESPPKRSRRSLQVLTSKGKTESSTSLSRKSSLQSLRRRASRDRLTASMVFSNEDIPPVPQAPKNQQRFTKSAESARKKDELWSVFRGLDADYQKFQSKSSALKANVVRTTLIPCLANYHDHQSTKYLRPEDLDRRINILNKWWSGLLELLNGKNSLSITGIDRPVYLEAILAIMTRPEWRVPSTNRLSPMAPPDTPKPHITASSSTSLESTGSDFLVDSVHHNIRNIFSQNLLSQLSYCIDRMSIRYTPASLVAFCGKTCAYAFFFCPHVADMLVRLWNPPADLIRRIINGFDLGLGSMKKAAAESGSIEAKFPAPVRSLSFKSHAALVRHLRAKSPSHPTALNINWFGPWLSRWSGRDTDLFSVFVKHFHILIDEIGLGDTGMSSLVYVPGLVPVHAQILVVLESTLNKQSAPQVPDSAHGPTSATFDDFIDSPDTAAAALPLGAANKFRAMSENRLVVMLRDALRDPGVPPSTKQILADSLCRILKVAARRISLFNHGACFALCDLVEELASIIPPYFKSLGEPDLLDGEFWLDVCKQMLLSNNSLTEVRAFGFVFALWDFINESNQRKENLCLELLLSEDMFYQFFSHWSPMVRAYFQRLLCWRLARHDGKSSELDIRIYCTLVERLSRLWDTFLSFQATTDGRFVPALSTAPCPPAPGRRLIIIRNDYDCASSNLFAGLDDMVAPALSVGQTQRDPQKTGVADASAQTQPQIKKGWKILKTMFGSATSNPKPGEVTPPGSSCDDREDPISAHVSDFTNLQTLPSDTKGLSGHEIQAATKPHRRSSFRFTLDWTDRQRRIVRDRALYPPCLPRPAQSFLQSIRQPAFSQSDSASMSLSTTSCSLNGSETDSSEVDTESHPTSNLTDDSAPPTKTTSLATTPASTTVPQAKSRLELNKYAGRALAEWALVVSECDNFFQRRRDEGVPCNQLVEVPTLCVEHFRKC